MGLLNPSGPIAQFKRNDCSISPVEVISLSGVRTNEVSIVEKVLLVTRFARCLKLKLFCGEPPPAEPVVSVPNKKRQHRDITVLPLCDAILILLCRNNVDNFAKKMIFIKRINRNGVIVFIGRN